LAQLDVDARLREIDQLCGGSDDDEENEQEMVLEGDDIITVIKTEDGGIVEVVATPDEGGGPPVKTEACTKEIKAETPGTSKPLPSVPKRAHLKRSGHMDEEDVRLVSEQRGYTVSKEFNAEKDKVMACYTCCYCQARVWHNSMILDHVNGEHRKIPLDCTECDYTTFLWKTLSNHRIKVHGLLSMKCPDCNFKGSVLWQMRQHLEEKHEGLYVEKFEAEYATKSGQPPKAKVKKPRKYGPDCPMSEHYDCFKDPGVSYKDKYKGRRYRCRKCDHECSQRNNMIIHLNVAHFKNNLLCPWCEFTTLNAITLESHVRQKHKYKKRECMVPGCNYHSVEEGRFQEHLLKKHGAVYDETDHSIKIYH